MSDVLFCEGEKKERRRKSSPFPSALSFLLHKKHITHSSLLLRRCRGSPRLTRKRSIVCRFFLLLKGLLVIYADLCVILRTYQ